MSAIQDIYELLIRKDLPFCIYILPNKRPMVIVHSNDQVSLTAENLDKDEPGFVFRPFDRTIAPKFIRASYAGSIEGFLWQKFQLLPDVVCKTDSAKMESNDIGKKDYVDAIEGIMDKIKSGNAEKVVYSRTITQATDKSPVEIFEKLSQGSSDAFRYMLHVGKGEVWLGASPETLLSKEKEMYRTVSLAGTVAMEDKGALFSDKNREEQAIVSDYIKAKLVSAGAMNLLTSDPYLSQASNVCHIKTNFDFELNHPSLADVLRLTETLHPTPAVGGQPLEVAEEMIRDTELNSRALYAGYLGVIDVLGDTALFVNIRCARYYKGMVRMYVGGGITKDSDPDTEWIETVAKSQLIQMVI